MINPYQSVKTVLNTFYPGSFPLLPMEVAEPEPSKPKKIAGSLLSSKEAAAYLGVSVATLRRLCDDRAITFIRVTAREYRFEPTELEVFKNARRYNRKSLIKP